MTESLHFLGGIGILFWEVVVSTFRGKVYGKLVLEQIYQIGIRSIPLVAISCGSIGMVMALQFGLGLEKFGGKLYVPKLVSITIAREIGPMFTSLMLAARVSSGIASEIGSMMVTQQIDAIRALGTSPIRKIVVPRVLATLIALPIISALSNIIAMVGGLVVGAVELGLDPNYYLLKVLTTVQLADYLSGFGKTFFFALFISVPACYYGLKVTDGTRGVGAATSKAVVTASIMILTGDFFLTKLFWLIEKW